MLTRDQFTFILAALAPLDFKQTANLFAEVDANDDSRETETLALANACMDLGLELPTGFRQHGTARCRTDADLTLFELKNAYARSGEHFEYNLERWKQACQSGLTQEGYWHWVSQSLLTERTRLDARIMKGLVTAA